MDIALAFADGRQAMAYMIRQSLVKNGLSDTFAFAMMANQEDGEVSEEDIKSLVVQEGINLAAKLRRKYTARAVRKYLVDKIGFDPRDVEVIVELADERLGDKAYVHQPAAQARKASPKSSEALS